MFCSLIKVNTDKAVYTVNTNLIISYLGLAFIYIVMVIIIIIIIPTKNMYLVEASNIIK